MKKQQLSVLTDEQRAVLNENYPASDDEARPVFPRFGMLAKDIIEESGSGKNKTIKVIESAGTFYTEKDLGEVDKSTGKKKWTKEFIEGEIVDLIITYHRKQLRKFDSSLEKYISSAIFDNAEQIIPLYLDKQIIKRGTQAQLQSIYPALTQKGKPTSDLKEETILFVIYKGELYQCNISQSSKWEFKAYKKTVNPSLVLTTVGSIEETFGKNTYRKMTFKINRDINQEEFEFVKEGQDNLRGQAESDNQYFLSQANVPILKEGEKSQADKDFDGV